MELSLAKYGFKSLPDPGSAIIGCRQILVKKNLNINRAIAVIELETIPADMGKYMKDARWAIAKKVGFFPFFYSLGIQLVLICPDISLVQDPMKYVARIDNQWAIIQSVFLIDERNKSIKAAATWGQFITGKYQREIVYELEAHYKLIPQLQTLSL